MKLYTKDSLEAIFKMYFNGWLDDEFRKRENLDSKECAFNTLSYSKELLRYSGTKVDFSVISIDDHHRMIVNGLEFTTGLESCERASKAINNIDQDRDDYFEALMDLIWERDRLQNFLEETSDFIDINKDGEIQDKFAEATAESLKFDFLFLEEYPLIAAELAKRNRWYLKEAVNIPLPGKTWWFYRHLGSKLSDSGRIILAQEPTFLQENVFYLSMVAAKSRTPIVANTSFHEPQATYAIAPFIGSLPMAAADSHGDISKVALIDRSETDLRFPIKISENSRPSFKEVYAELETPLCQLETEQTMGQWRIKGRDVPAFNDTRFLLSSISNGDIIGSGIIEEDGIATLQNGNWNVLQKHSLDVSDLLLTCILIVR